MKHLFKNSSLWKTRYYEKNKKEHSLYLYNSLEIEKTIKRLLKLYKLILNDLEIKYSNSQLEIFLSYYSTVKSFKLLQQITKKKSILIKPLSNSKIKLSSNKILFKKRLVLLSFLKKKLFKKEFLNKLLLQKNNFSEILLESLSLFTRKKLKLIVIVQNLNKGISFRLKNKFSNILKEIFLKLRKFDRNIFFKETLNILLLTICKSINLKLLTNFIAFQFSVMKKHNMFLIFLKQTLKLLHNSHVSVIKGLKIIIKGRLNGAARARSKIIQTGSTPLQTNSLKILHSKSTSYTPNGTFSIKSWVCLNT
uniref:ribosomal protein S3 n=1 Tax=Helicotheca tamesis TaxID=374047 RepID=UPI002027F838|nr:ribosomal protein S3 [Helicotheca tamesis]QYB23029.1 ribosomal protein S3 [Helicotheca tamesis]